MNSEREFDLVLMGATGFTGRLVAEHLLARHGAGGSLRWALAGRDMARLQQVRTELGNAAQALPLIQADSHDGASLDAMVQRTRVVLTTVGPYAVHGEALVAACCEAGTDYCDLSGETQFIRRMIDRHEAQARHSGARIVHCCGFDSIPSDLGVWFLEQAALERFGSPLSRVRLRVKAAKGGLSGGTYASMLNLTSEARRDPDTARILKNPYALCPPEWRDGPRQPVIRGAAFDDWLQAWCAPFVMAAINTRVVQRSNALLDGRYGKPFLYDEAVLTGRGWRGRARAMMVSAGLGAFALAAAFRPTRRLLERMVLPKPGEGPTREQREAGYFDLIVIGRTEGGDELRGRVRGNRDPGYGATSRMIGESAVLLGEIDRQGLAGGFWTPATAFGNALIERLEAHAGMQFSIETS